MAKDLAQNQSLSFSPHWLKFITVSFRPIIRLLVKNKVEFKTFINLTRDIFVEEAEDYINKSSKNKRGKISSIAYQTGLDRREVSAILKSNHSQDLFIEQNRSREGCIMDQWKNDPMFCDDKGNPLPLKRSGPGMSFETLVQRFGKNISHGPILKELNESSCVLIKDDKVHYLTNKYTPSSTSNAQKVGIASISMNRLANTLAFNLTQDEGLLFQRNLYSVRVKKDQIQEFKSEVSKMLDDVLINVITPQFDAIELKYETNIKSKQSLPVGLGLFYFQQTRSEE